MLHGLIIKIGLKFSGAVREEHWILYGGFCRGNALGCLSCTYLLFCDVNFTSPGRMLKLSMALYLSEKLLSLVEGSG